MKITAATVLVLSSVLHDSLGFQPLRSSRGVSTKKTVPFSTVGASSEEAKPGAPLQPPTPNSAATTTTVPPPPATTTTTTPSLAFEELKLPNLPTSIQDLQMPEMLKNLEMPDMSKVLSTFQDGGEFGSRGEAYVALQFALILAVAFGGIPFLSDVLSLGGPLLLLAGIAGMVLSVSNLGSALSPFTTPSGKSTQGVVTEGVYQYIRHPMYTALIMTCTGWSLVTDSASRLVLTALLVALLQVKTDQEEKNLVEKYPQAYPAYQEKVAGKFFPVEFYKDTKNKFMKN